MWDWRLAFCAWYGAGARTIWRRRRGWNAAISDYERGKKSPELRTLRRMLAAMGFGLGALDHARRFVGLVRLEGTLGAVAEGGAIAVAPEEAARAARPPAAEVEAAAGTAAAALGALARLAAALARPVEVGDRAEGEGQEGEGGGAPERVGPAREAAAAAWQELAGLPAAEMQRRVREETAAVSWAVCERACEESIAAAARDAALGVQFAEAAVALAERASGQGTRRCRLRACAGAPGECAPGAGRAAGGRGGDGGGTGVVGARRWSAESDLLDEARMLGLEASLRRTQRRLEESLALLDGALAAGRDRRSTAVHLINKASTLEELGRAEEAIALLLFTAPLVDGGREPRLRFCVESNLTDLLSKAERFEEAAARLPEAKRLARLGGRELDLVRLRWTEGRIAAGLGDVERGAQLLAKVRGELASRGIAYDTAVVTLELAVLYAKEWADGGGQGAGAAPRCAAVPVAGGARRGAGGAGGFPAGCGAGAGDGGAGAGDRGCTWCGRGTSPEMRYEG